MQYIEQNYIVNAPLIIRCLDSFVSYILGRMSKSGSIKDGEKEPCDVVPEKDNDEIKLEAKMSLLNGVTVIVGSIIGSGIFVSPTGVLKYTGSVNASLLVWTASGIYSMVRNIFVVSSKNGSSVSLLSIYILVVSIEYRKRLCYLIIDPDEIRFETIIIEK